jgi:large subunit ribosomal protein L4
VKLPVVDASGKELRKLDVDDSVFGIEPNAAVLHQAYVAQRNNKRAGTANTKTRGEVRGSTAKIRRQKYTGRARAGSNRSPIRVGGGVAFGPHQRSYAQSLNRKMNRLAIRSALSGKVADGQLKIIDQISMDAPRTKDIVGTLRRIGLERSALIVTAQSDRNVLASIRNLQKTKVLPAAYLNVMDMLNHQGMLITEEAVKIAEGLWAVEAPPKKEKAAPRRRTAARRKADETVPAEKEEAATEATGEAEPAEPKPAPRRRAAAKKEAPEAQAAAEEKPKRRATRAKKTDADASTEEKPKPRRRTKKANDGEGGS